MPRRAPPSAPRWHVDEAEDPLATMGPFRAQLFLGHYTAEDVADALARRGFWGGLAERGYPDATLTLQQVEGDDPRLRLHQGDVELGEVRAHRGLRGDDLVLIVDWIEMRDPRASFTPERPRLPGQRAPGLGLGRIVLDLLTSAAARIGAAALVVTPEHFHNAVLYARGGFRYADPDVERRFRALEASLAPLPLAEASWKVDRGEVADPATGKPLSWTAFAKDQVLSLS